MTCVAAEVEPPEAHCFGSGRPITAMTIGSTNPARSRPVRSGVKDELRCSWREPSLGRALARSRRARKASLTHGGTGFPRSWLFLRGLLRRAQRLDFLPPLHRLVILARRLVQLRQPLRRLGQAHPPRRRDRLLPL